MKRRIALLALTLLAAAFMAACGGGGEEGKELRRVTLMLDWTPNTNHTGIYVAKEKGWYAEEGLDVQIVEPAEAGVTQVVGAGQADFGISFQEMVIPAREQGVPVVSIAAIIQHNTSSLASLAERNIVRPRDLEGKTYGGFGGALEREIISRLVACDGGDPSKVKFVEVGNVDYLVGMDRGDYDVVWIFDGWEGIRFTEIEKRMMNFIRFIDHTDCIPDWYTPLIITNERMIADQPDVVRAFMRATARGYQFAIDHPAEAADILLKAVPELDPQLVKLSAEFLAKKYTEPGRPWGLQDEKVWVDFERFLRQAKLTSEAVDVSKAYTNEFLPRE